MNQVYRHKTTGALATLGGAAHGTDHDRGPKIGVVWHDQFSTVGAFTRAEFAHEFEPVEYDTPDGVSSGQ